MTTSSAWAKVTLCLQVSAADAEREGLTKLAASEVARHPSHRVVKEDCQSHLRIESFRVLERRYLTVQLADQVPVRHEIEDDRQLAKKLAEATTLVLGNDPMYLSEDPAKWSRMQKASHSVLVRGQNTLRLEVMEILTRTGTGPAGAPGFAVGLWRGADQWQVFGRLHLGGWLQGISGSERALRLRTGADAGLVYETSARANTSAYVAASAGLLLLRFEGRVEPQDEQSLDSVTHLGGALSTRVGIRTLRWFDFDADVFAGLQLPLFLTSETDSLLFGDHGIYTPILEVGVGVGF